MEVLCIILAVAVVGLCYALTLEKHARAELEESSLRWQADAVWLRQRLVQAGLTLDEGRK